MLECVKNVDLTMLIESGAMAAEPISIAKRGGGAARSVIRRIQRQRTSVPISVAEPKDIPGRLSHLYLLGYSYYINTLFIFLFCL